MASSSNSSGLPDDADTGSSDSSPVDEGATPTRSAYDKTFDSKFTGSTGSRDSNLEPLDPELEAKPSFASSDGVLSSVLGAAAAVGVPLLGAAIKKMLVEPTPDMVEANVHRAVDAFVLFNESEGQVEHIVAKLTSHGVTTHFWRRDIAAGEDWRQREMAELKSCQCVLLFLGERGWGPTHRELAETAISEGKYIIPVLLSETATDEMKSMVPKLLERRYVTLCPATPQLVRDLARQIRQLRPSDGSVAPAMGLGETVGISREASAHEARLNVSEYASVLAALIRSVGSKESLSMAILGPWGRGKTYLMQRVKSLLEKDSFEVVTFSAWKYRTAPEVWAHLYETLYERARAGGWRVLLRTGVLRRSLWPATMTFLVLAVTLSTVSQKAAVSAAALSTFGLVGSLYLIGMGSTLFRAGHSLKTTYLQIPRHHERLGLQFAIGDDLKALLAGWIPEAATWKQARNKVFREHGVATVCFVLSALAVWGTLSAVVWELSGSSLATGFSVVVALGAILIIAAMPALAFVNSAASRTKIVLVVDDLDRCLADQMLEIIECLQLFLDDDFVKQRLKLVMLIEEEILRRALIRKYVANAEQSASETSATHQLVTDNLEKLFLFWIRLEPLRPDELKEIFSGFCDNLCPDPPRPVTDPPIGSAKKDDPKPQPPAPIGSPKPASGDSIDGTTEPVGTKRTESPSRLVPTPLSLDEKKAILELVDDVRFESGRESWGPRAARSFVFRYQLARMLLMALEHKFEPRELVAAIGVASDRSRKEPDSSFDPVVFRVARQVS